MPTTYVAPTDNLTTVQAITVSDTLYILEGSISIDAAGEALFVQSGLADTFMRIEGGTILNPHQNGSAIIARSPLTCFFGPDSLVRGGFIGIEVSFPLDLTNYGTIQAVQGVAVDALAGGRIENFGTISGVVSLGAATGVLNNFGTIAGTSVAIYAGGTSVQVLNTGLILGNTQLGSSAKLVNSGTIIGDVDGTGALGITFDGRYGRVLGAVKGSAGLDLLKGGVFADTFNGEDGGDFLEGNDGDDLLFGSSGADFLWGGAGADRLDGGDDGNPSLDQDLALYQGSVTASLANAALNTGEAAGDVFIEIEGFSGSAQNDTFIGDAFANTLFGNSGDDRLDGGAGVDRLVGDAGNDTYLVDNAADVVVETGSSATDTLLASVSYTLAAGVQVEIMRANAGSTGLTLTGNSQGQSIFGGNGADILNGSAGIDKLAGGNASDTYFVDTLTDTITEAAGAVAGAADRVLFTGTANQTFILGANVENLVLLGAAATKGNGNALANTLFGNGANNTLSGFANNDTLSGLAGNDILIGGLGRDRSTGGLGNDVFRFAAADSSLGANVDIITDFDDAGNDTIDLSALFGPRMTFRGAQAFTGLGQVRINDVAGADVIVEVNRVGGLAADFQIRLAGTTLATMTASDFLL